MGNKKVSELLKKYQEGKCTPAEKAFLEQMLEESAIKDQDLYSQREMNATSKAAWEKLTRHTSQRQPAYKKLIPYAAVAASLLIAGIAYHTLQQNPSPTLTQQITILSDVGPGGNKATLYLSNGTQISLNNATRGIIAQQTGMNILKTKEGELEYQATDNKDYENSAIKQNKIVTPRGGQFKIQLPDGTKVWINAASSLSFPSSFEKQDNRTVVLSGEAYFEVTKDQARPFIVETPNQRVQVLGTHFNIHAYADEKETQTTLLEGSVSVFSTQLNLSKTLTPGQAAIHQSKELIVKKVDVKEAVAWKNGKLNFNETELRALMKEVSRWYDLEVVYDDNIGTRKFTGGIDRNTNLSTLLEILKTSGIEFTIEKGPQGTRLIVKSNQSTEVQTKTK